MNGWQVLRTTNGNSCANAIPLVIDGVCRTYTPSSTVEPSYAICNYGSVGNVIYFSFTTDANAGCIEVDISTSVTSQADVSLYRSCSPVQDFDTLALCLNDGKGVWSTRSSVGDNPLLPNTTYYLRIRTGQFFNGNLSICAKKSTNNNYSCATATTITAMPLTDNNACATDNYQADYNLCASSTENISWYKATYTSAADSIVVFDLNCDNFDSQQGQTGYQIGQFKNNCNGLSIDCKNGYDAMIAFYMYPPIGTVYYFGVDGMFNAKCKYTIFVGINAILHLDAKDPDWRKKIRRKDHVAAIELFPTYIKINKHTTTSVYDISGRLLKRYSDRVIETSGWKPGIYIIQNEFQTIKYLKL